MTISPQPNVTTGTVPEEEQSREVSQRNGISVTAKHNNNNMCSVVAADHTQLLAAQAGAECDSLRMRSSSLTLSTCAVPGAPLT